MNKLLLLNITLILFFPLLLFAQKTKTDANIIGHVINSNGEHMPFVTIYVEGTAIWTATDETGHYRLVNMPEGTFVIKAKFMGYKPAEAELTTTANKTKELNFTLEEDILGLDEVVITGTRNETNRTESSAIVHTITPIAFSTTQSVMLSEGLNFCPGLRMESNCQNCGFSRVRMNGMDGPYSQILINSRPVFSGLAGVYGLELIPSSMIERIEVIRGGGSALYGGNAIAGTINLILKDPVTNSHLLNLNSGLVGVGVKDSGEPSGDISISFNSSLISSDAKSGMALYGFYRNRQPFDANDDGFSELTSIRNITAGTRLYHRFGTRSKITADFFHIHEKRRGGDKFDYVPHMAGIAEALEHDITSGAITFDAHFRGKDLLSVYLSGQGVDRDSYYGANQSLSDYGNTKDFSYTAGAQYNASFGISNAVFGIEQIGGWLEDTKLGFPDLDNVTINYSDSSVQIPYVENRTIAKQISNTTGVFAQYEIKVNRLQIAAGIRFDRYEIDDRNPEGSDHKGKVFIPRLNFKYDVFEYMQTRISYSQGYRAPQIFDEDLHIETSGARKVIHVNDPNLKQEKSHSFMASVDFNRQIGSAYIGVLIEGFYTLLNDAFTNEFGEPDEEGTVIYTRTNAGKGAFVRGVNIEMNAVPSDNVSIKGGFTWQTSQYEEAQEFDEKNFFRTPDDYGYITLDWKLFEHIGISSSGSYTGRMLVPYFGPQLEDPDDGELRISQNFFDMSIKLHYDIPLNGSRLQIYGGVKNLFNSYQSDFDNGIDRDPGYVYGPMAPRSVYLGLKLGNMLR